MRSEAAVRQSVGVPADSRPVTPRHRWGRRGLLALGVLVALVGLTVLLNACSVHAVPGNSDGATVILEGQSFAHGHLMLSGWALSLDSFWLLDVLFYAVFVLASGVRPELLNLVPAAIAALVVLVSVRLAVLGSRRAPAVVAGGVVVALLALPTHLLAALYLQGPLHVATALWCLVAFLLLRRLRFDLAFAGAVVLLAAGIVSDLQALFFGTVPVALAGLTLMLRRRSLRPGHVPLLAALASGVLAWVVREVARAIGTFYVNSPQQAVTRSEVLTNVHLAFTYTAHLLGVGSAALVTGGNPVALENVHVIGALVVAAGALAAVVRLVLGVVSGDPRDAAAPGTGGAGLFERLFVPAASADLSVAGDAFLDDVLVFAMVAAGLIFIALTQAPAWPYARYLSAAVIYGAILAGRFLARLVSGLRQGWLSRSLAAVAVAVIALFGVTVAVNLNQPPPPQYAAGLATFLEQHHLHSGLGDYWSSSITTVESRQAVRIRPVIAGLDGRLVPYPRNSEPSWFRGRYRFFVFQPPTPFGGANQTAAELTFGKPAQIYAIPGFIVLVWSSPHALPHT